MARPKYGIESYDWQYDGDDTWTYVDDDMRMIVTLQRDSGCSPQAQGIEEPYTVVAQSATYTDQDNYYYYDAMCKEYCNGPIITRVPACAVLDPMGDPRSLVLPDWLIDHMQYLVECDNFAESCAYAWAQAEEDTAWTSSDEREASAKAWWDANYPNGDERAPWGYEDMLAIADMYCMLYQHGDTYRVRQ